MLGFKPACLISLGVPKLLLSERFLVPALDIGSVARDNYPGTKILAPRSQGDVLVHPPPATAIFGAASSPRNPVCDRRFGRWRDSF